jgi:signal transduction histidine kinase
MERNNSILDYSALTTVSLAHDLQNLLSIMARCVDSIAARTPGLARAHRDFSELNAALDGAFHLSRQLLAVGGLQDVAEPLVVDLGELIVRCRGMLQRLLGDAVHIVLSIRQRNLLVEAAPVQLEWMLLNLAANARDSMPEGGVLRIETYALDEWVAPGETDARRCVCFTVRDEGGGVPDHIQTRLFEPFFTTKPLGTGIGLTSVAMTVRALKGWLYVESSATAGTIVHVVLPRWAGTRPTAAPST